MVFMRAAPPLVGMVYDVTTGKPVETFRVTPGVERDGWFIHESKPGHDGKFELPIVRPQQPNLLKFDAAGYETFVTHALTGLERAKNAPPRILIAARSDALFDWRRRPAV
jgi:hypothetical protein